MKRLTKVYCTLVIIICTLFVGIYAWTTKVDFLDINDVSISSTSGYYESGNGTEDDPFIISRPKHLYNLAWLQDLGFYDDNQYYFELKNDIDMENLWIPPIGTQDHPFIGVFNGNGKLINNIRVGTTQARLGKNPGVLNGVGLFGFISDNGATDTTKKIGNVHDFTISDIYVECGLSDTYAGLIAGNVEANLSNVGVYTGRISYLGNANNQMIPKSEYTLIGYVNENKVDWEDKPESTTGNNLILNGTGFDEVSTNTHKVVPNASAILIGHLSSTSKSAKKLIFCDKVGDNYNFITDLSEISLPPNFTSFWDGKSERSFTTLRPRDKIEYSEDGTLLSNVYKFSSSISNEYLTIPENYAIPQGTIWFKPATIGTCYMLFVRDNNTDDSEMSIFKVSRDSGIKLKEIAHFTSLPAYDRETAILCKFDIDELGEYIIGATSDKAGHFIYLELVGTGEEGGDVNEKIINVDFVPSPTTIIDSNYTNELKSNVLIKIALINSEELLQANVVLYFKRKDDGTEVNYQINGIGISIQNVGTGNLVASETLITSGVFPPVT